MADIKPKAVTAPPATTTPPATPAPPTKSTPPATTPGPEAITKPAPAPASAWRTPVGWAAVGLGVVTVAVGVSIYTRYLDGQKELDALVDDRDAGGKIVGIGSAAYTDRQNTLNSDATMATAALIGGGVVAGVGAAILLGGGGDKVALAPWPGVRGMNVRLRF